MTDTGNAIQSICLEGGDGCGKTTVMRALAPALRELGYDVMPLREPGGNTICESIRNVLLDDASDGMYPMTEAMLYAASRYQLMRDEIIPAINAGKLVLLDRFVYSSFVYQGYVAAETANLNADQTANLVRDVMKINDIATNGWRPTLTFCLDASPEVSMKRISANRSGDDINRFDTRGPSYHKMIRDAYLSLDKFEEYRVINAEQPITDIVDEIIAEIDGFRTQCGN